jgi:hypothetical protein
MTSDDDGRLPVLLAPLTNPVQPFKNAAERIKIAAPNGHTHPLALVFTFLVSFGRGQLVSWDGGWDPRKWLLCLP